MRVELLPGSKPVYLDTNIFIYAVDSADAEKNAIARNLVDNCFSWGIGVFSVQVMAEWRNVMIRKFSDRLSAVYRTHFLEWLAEQDPAPMTGALVCRAEAVSIRYSISPFDSTHVQSALDANCRYFLSEDMQDGLVIDGRLEIVNPFAAPRT